MNEILRKSEENGKITWRHKQISSCTYCDKKRKYQTYPRSTRYHQKGESNYDKPIYYSGVEFNHGFISFQGHGDMCWDCCKSYQVIERLVSYILDHDLKIEIPMQGYIGKYIKDEIKICYSCREEIQESEMKPRSTVMGDGYYPSGCPKCGVESLPFGKSHDLTKRFVMIDNPRYDKGIRELDEYLKSLEQTKSDEMQLRQSKWSKFEFFVMNPEWRRYYLDINVKNKTFKKSSSYVSTPDEIKDILKRNDYMEIVQENSSSNNKKNLSAPANDNECEVDE